MDTPLIMIPALLCDADLYTDMIAAMGDHVEVRVMMSPKPDLAASVADILSRAPETFILAGTSYGGALALEIALAAPERVTALWIMGIGGDAADRDQVLAMASGFTENFAAMVESVATRAVDDTAAAARENVIAMAHRVGSAIGADEARALAGRAAVWDRLHLLTMPCLVMWGAHDAMVPVAEGRKLAESIPHAHFYAIPNCGHFPTLEKPEEAAAIALDFLGLDHHRH